MLNCHQLCVNSDGLLWTFFPTKLFIQTDWLVHAVLFLFVIVIDLRIALTVCVLRPNFALIMAKGLK